MPDQSGSSWDRLNAMGDSTEPIKIVPATPDYTDVNGGLPTQAMPEAHAPYAATAAQAPYAATAAQVAAPAAAAQRLVPIPAVEPPLIPLAPAPQRDWGAVFIGAFVALVIGAVLGYLVGHSSKSNNQDLSTTSPSVLPTDLSTGGTATSISSQDQAAFDARVNDILSLLIAQAQQQGHVVLPTPYPKLDQLLSLSASSADTGATVAGDTNQQIATLTKARDDLTAQVATLQQQSMDLQTQLTESENNRIELQATLDTVDVANSQTAANQAMITDLQNQLADSKTKLDTANASLKSTQDDLAKANASLKTTQDDLAKAKATLDQLDVQVLDNLVGMDIAKVRDLAKNNGWNLVEQHLLDPTQQQNIVLTQQPAKGANMITGSVLYVQIATPQ
ncbi:MAG: hypothetical protein JWN62_1669 [Acidimicrobiales bacterium]|nr:hypothetical protein [Acidimicrobiales bacterium]